MYIKMKRTGISYELVICCFSIQPLSLLLEIFYSTCQKSLIHYA